MSDDTNSTREIETLTAASAGDPAVTLGEERSMVNAPPCAALKADGTPCRMRPIRHAEFCFAHDPEHAAEAAEARRLGGQRRRRERLTASEYRVQGIKTVADIQRVFEIAVLDILALEPSLGRSSALFRGCGLLLKLRDAGDLEERMQAIEIALRPPRKPRGTS